VGNPQDLTWSYTEGIISSIRDSGKESPTYKVFQTQTPINQGNSGGGLYRMNGELVGIIAWTKDKSQSEGIGFAIAYEDFLKLYNVNE
jgi:serine protease Do